VQDRHNISLTADTVSTSTSYGGVCAKLPIADPSSSSTYTSIIGGFATYYDTGLGYYKQFEQFRSLQDVSAVDGIQIYFSSGNIASGEFRLYGVY